MSMGKSVPMVTWLLCPAWEMSLWPWAKPESSVASVAWLWVLPLHLLLVDMCSLDSDPSSIPISSAPTQPCTNAASQVSSASPCPPHCGGTGRMWSSPTRDQSFLLCNCRNDHPKIRLNVSSLTPHRSSFHRREPLELRAMGMRLCWDCGKPHSGRLRLEGDRFKQFWQFSDVTRP